MNEEEQRLWNAVWDPEANGVDDSGDLTPYDFSALERRARYNALPADIKECVALLKEDQEWWAATSDDPNVYISCEETDAATVQLLDYLGAL